MSSFLNRPNQVDRSTLTFSASTKEKRQVNLTKPAPSNFGASGTPDDSKLPPGKPSIVEVDHPYDPSSYQIKYFNHRRPFAYDEAKNRITVGAPGMFHSTLQKYYDDDEGSYGYGSMGSINALEKDIPEDYDKRYLTHSGEPGEIGAGGDIPEGSVPQHVLNALLEHFGEGYWTRDPDEFNFQAKYASGPLPRVVEHKDPAQTGMMVPGRRPFAYHPDTHTVHLGPEGMVHPALLRLMRINSGDREALNYQWGSVNLDVAYGAFGESNTISSANDQYNPEYTKAEDWTPTPEMAEAISQHLGIDLSVSDQDRPNWSFGSVSSDEDDLAAEVVDDGWTFRTELPRAHTVGDMEPPTMISHIDQRFAPSIPPRIQKNMIRAIGTLAGEEVIDGSHDSVHANSKSVDLSINSGIEDELAVPGSKRRFLKQQSIENEKAFSDDGFFKFHNSNDTTSGSDWRFSGGVPLVLGDNNDDCKHNAADQVNVSEIISFREKQNCPKVVEHKQSQTQSNRHNRDHSKLNPITAKAYRPHDDGWNFTAASDLPTVEEMNWDNPGGTFASGYNPWSYRRPFLYDRDRHHVIVGPVGGLHNEFPEHLDIPNFNENPELLAQNNITMGTVEDSGEVNFSSDYITDAIDHLSPDEMDNYHNTMDPRAQGIADALKASGIIESTPQWDFSANIAARVDPEPWSKGNRGKGYLFENGELKTWNTDTTQGRPHHHEVLGLGPGKGRPLYIEPDGEVSTGGPQFKEDEVRALQQAGFSVDSWVLPFGFTAAVKEQTPDGYQPRVEGQPWKGLWLANGEVWTWALDADDSPHHHQAAGLLYYLGILNQPDLADTKEIKDFLWGEMLPLADNAGPIGGAEQWWEFSASGDPFQCDDPDCKLEHIEPDGDAAYCDQCGELTKHTPCDHCKRRTSKLAGMTQTQKRKQWLKLQETYGADGSEPVHRFDNGWTVNRLTNYRDAVLEGESMGNCFSPYTMEPESHHVIWQEHPQGVWHNPYEEEWRTSDQVTDDDRYYGNWGYAGVPSPENLNFDYPIDHMYSLRDPDGVPHLSSDDQVILGRHNIEFEEANPEYQKMWMEYEQAQNPEAYKRAWGSASYSKVATMTLPQQQREWDELGPHTHEVMHEYPDGWTVRAARSDKDINAIGHALRNCWQEGSFYMPSYREQMSLHDQNGIPRVAFNLNKNGLISQPMGRNNRYINEHLYGRLKEFADSNGYIIPPESTMEYNQDHPEYYGDFVDAEMGRRSGLTHTSQRGAYGLPAPQQSPPHARAYTREARPLEQKRLWLRGLYSHLKRIVGT